MRKETIQITSFDFSRLANLIGSLRAARYADEEGLDRLEEELARGKVVAPASVPDDVVTMNSVVMLRDVDSGQEMTCRLVFPTEASASENRVSVLAPVGTAILGYQVGDCVEWPVPSGTRHIAVEKIVYQPEAAGDFHL
jgi:regulator of nucleoside diphosphate kinase